MQQLCRFHQSQNSLIAAVRLVCVLCAGSNEALPRRDADPAAAVLHARTISCKESYCEQHRWVELLRSYPLTLLQRFVGAAATKGFFGAAASKRLVWCCSQVEKNWCCSQQNAFLVLQPTKGLFGAAASKMLVWCCSQQK